MMRRLLILALMLWPAVAGATNYYAKPSGSDAATGLSYANAFQTLDKLSDSCNAAGDTGFIAPGEYDAASGNTVDWCDYSKDVTMLLNHSGSSGNPIVFRSMHDSTRPTICGNRGVWTRYAVASFQQNWIVLDSIIVKQAWRGIYFESCNHIVVRNVVACSTFINGGGAHVDNNAGIMMGYCGNGDSNLVRACSVWANAGWFSGARYNGINHDGIQTYRTLAGDRFTNNVIFDQVEGIRMKSGLASNVEIDSNVIHDCSDAGIYGYGFDYASVHHNIVYDVSGSGILPLARGNVNDSDIHYLKIWNNTVYHSGGAGILVGNSEDTPPASNDYSFWSHLSIFNNIVVNSNDTSREMGTLAPVRNSGQWEVIDSQLVFNWNDAFDAGDATAYRWYITEGSPLNYTLAQMISNTNHADNSIYLYPGFTDTTVAGGYNLNIDPASAAATGGRGSGYPTYMGALDPNVTITCPTVTQVSPSSGSTQAKYTVPLLANFYTDDAGDDIIVTLYGEKTDNTPDVLLLTDTIVQDSTNWTYNWGTLLEDSTYYWQLIATDTSCADTSPVWNVLVDSIPPVSSSAPLLIYGSKLQGVKFR